MSDKSSYMRHGEIHPFIQKATRNSKEVEKEGGGGRRAWDQREDETTRAYSAFLMYLDLGPNNRAQSKLAKIIYGNENSTEQLSKWSVRHDWVNRAEAFDRYHVEQRQTKMEGAIESAEDVMLSYLPKVVENLAKAAAGEITIGRSERQAISDFLDRVGPAKQRRAQPVTINNNNTIIAPTLPQEVQQDTSDVPEAEIIEEHSTDLIPEKLRNKKKT